MARITVIVDGFNLYHAIDDIGKNYLKWLNIKSLAKEFVHPDDTIQRILFFTAYPGHTPKEVRERYKAYTAAVEAIGATVIKGQFKRRSFRGKDTDGVRGRLWGWEEKESDVNVAIHLLEEAYEKKSDVILLFTNDSDISPAIKMSRIKNPNLKINVISPPLIEGKEPNYELHQASGQVETNSTGKVFHKVRKITETLLERNLLPEKIDFGTANIIRPANYTPPSHLRIKPIL